MAHQKKVYDSDSGMYRRLIVYLLYISSHDTKNYNFQKDSKHQIVWTEVVHVPLY